MDWPKGNAVGSRAFYEISTHPAILDVVAALLGEDVMLWGASIQSRSSGAVHPWHSDIESSAPSNETVAVWIGLEHTTRDSSLRIVPHSHRFGVTIQEVRSRLGIARDEASNDAILDWARERDGRAEVVSLEMTDGEALFFDGKLWHGSDNVSGKTRRALLLQYGRPDDPVRIPDLRFLDWPFRQLEEPRPPCLMLRGHGTTGANRIVPAPVPAGPPQVPALNSRIHQLEIPLPPPREEGWEVHPIFRGRTADVATLSCHASALGNERSPHPPHTHKEEELLVVLAGEIEVLVPDDATSGGKRRLTRGHLAYYPTGFAHTLRTVSTESANYLMFKWHGPSTRVESLLPFGHFEALEEGSGARRGFQARKLFQGPTAYLRKLHCHSSTLTPDAGYEPHIDAYDVAIIVLEGEVETLGERVGPHGVIFCRAGEPHGMRNPGDVTARYLVFEFHGHPGLQEALHPGTHPRVVPRRQPLWKRTLKAILPRKVRRLLSRLKKKLSR